MTKFHVGFVGPCRDGVPGEVVAIEPRARVGQQLVYLRGDVIHTTPLSGRQYVNELAYDDLLPPAPKMVTRWIVVQVGAGFPSEEAARTYARSWSAPYNVVPVEVEVK